MEYVDDIYLKKRFDFISIPLKLIIEYDGIQHFDHVEYFHTYNDFILNHDNDLLKQKFIKDNNFNLIRIRDNITLANLYELLKDIKFDDDEPKAIFITNNKIKICSTNKLMTNEENKIAILEQKIKSLEDELSLFSSNPSKNLSKNSDVKQFNDEQEINVIKQFIKWLYDKNLFVGRSLSNIMYKEYSYWGTNVKKLKKILRARDFTNIMIKVIKENPNIPIKFSSERTKLSSLNLLECNLNVLNEYYFEGFIDVNRYDNSTSYIFDEQITDKDLSNFLNLLNNNKSYKIKLYKEHLMLEHLINEGNEIAINYKNKLKNKKST